MEEMGLFTLENKELWGLCSSLQKLSYRRGKICFSYQQELIDINYGKTMKMEGKGKIG